VNEYVGVEKNEERHLAVV